ncbi:hypothetical protein I3843_15G135800 [Carya illinoinensis]|nr:hypothetical protein I3843_15G135800 [Carya illinoinensis]
MIISFILFNLQRDTVILFYFQRDTEMVVIITWNLIGTHNKRGGDLQWPAFRRCKSLLRPINFFQLEGLESVDVTLCPNFVNFVEEIGQNGQSTPCTQENEISSSMELLTLPPPESNSSLRYLSLSCSSSVSLPLCIEGFVGLCELYLVDCKQLEEILHLPPNIKERDAKRYGLLERFHHVLIESSFGTPDLKRLRKIDLLECNKVHVNVGNHAPDPDPLLVQERFREKKSSMIIYPGNRIPKWFMYCKETTSYSNSIQIEIDHNASMCFGHQIVALVLCFVLGPLPASPCTNITINDQFIEWASPSLDAHHVYLKYIAENSIDEMLSRSYREGNNMRFTFGTW